MSDIREYKRLLEEIRWLDADLQGKDFLLTWERTLKEVQQVLYTAEALKWLYENNISTKCFDFGLAILQIKDTTTQGQNLWPGWNRLSYGLAANSLGLTVHQLGKDEGEIQQAPLSFLKEAEFIGIQDTDPGYPVIADHQGKSSLESPPTHQEQGENKTGNTKIKESAAALDSWEKSKDGIESEPLLKRPGIINLQCNLDHPVQAMADILVLKHLFGSLERLVGKKIGIIWQYSPINTIPISVPQGFVALVTRFNMEVTLAHPGGYELSPSVIDVAHTNSENSDGRLTTTHEMDYAFEDADVVYCMNWPTASAIDKKLAFKDWTCTEEKMKLTRNGKAFLMDSDPAMAYKAYIISAMMLNHRFKEPARLLGNLRKRNIKRLLFSF